jgi:outer membrane protein assembly factor BamB
VEDREGLASPERVEHPWGKRRSRPPSRRKKKGSDFLALDAGTGALLWKMSLGGQINSGPMSYSIGGRQYVTVAAGNALFAFALRQ